MIGNGKGKLGNRGAMRDGKYGASVNEILARTRVYQAQIASHGLTDVETNFENLI